MHICGLVSTVSIEKNPVTSKWDGGATYIPYIFRFPLKTDQIFNTHDGHCEEE